MVCVRKVVYGRRWVGAVVVVVVVVLRSQV